VLAYGFTTLALERVVAHTDLRNRPAQRLLERLAFRREAERNGETTELRYVLREREWREAAQSAQDTQTRV